MMSRAALNKDMMAQVNGGAKKDKETKHIMDQKWVLDENNMPYNLTTPDGKHYHSDGNHHLVSIEVK